MSEKGKLFKITPSTLGAILTSDRKISNKITKPQCVQISYCDSDVFSFAVANLGLDMQPAQKDSYHGERCLRNN